MYGFGSIGSLLSEILLDTASSYVLLTIPMFILMAEFLAVSGLTRDIIRSSDRWLGRLPGGLGVACVAASAVMAAVVGSSTASAASMARAAFPGMKKMGYSDSLSTGIIAIAGTLAIMLPPSIVLVVYGIVTELSIGRLLVAGIVPGLLTAAGYAAVIVGWALVFPKSAPRGVPFNFRSALRGSVEMWPILLLIVVVMSALYSGMATATEVGAVGALGAAAIIFVMRRMNREGTSAAIANTVRTTAMIISIILAAHVFGYYLTWTQVTQDLVQAVADSGLSPWLVLLLVLAVYLVLGMFLDQLAILVLTLPVSFPLMTSLGFDGIWFGIIVTKTVEIGLVTPPLGLNVLITSSVTTVPLKKAFAGVAPFIAIELLLLGILIAFPQLSLMLVESMD
ncbi:TRAP transporter large permease [Marinobacter aromaticivorans]|uniref:TRAP transporter large permease protein n=1 Tax=Marinobacter aromaticivorans TaxID=1494078 RepID=A0ABW2IZK2_9GAMM|nr:TRAP transporter large permease [Marinobacter aromaticivorans]